MKRALLGGLTVFAFTACTLGAGDAHAQGTPSEPPPPLTAVPTTPQAASPYAPIGGGALVRLHIRMYRGKGSGRVYVRRSDGAITPVCAPPCVADVPVGSELRITYGRNEDEPYSFIVPGDLGSEIDLEVRGPSVGPLVGGIVLMGTGGAFVLSGLLFVALSDVTSSSSSSTYSTHDSAGFKTIGYVFIGLGAAAAVSGLVWLTTRSTEPRVLDTPHRGVDVYGRTQTLLGDIAAAKPREPTQLVPAPVTPLGFSVSF